MAKILAIETSTPVCSVALRVDQLVYEVLSEIPHQHTQLILPMIEQLLTENQLKLSQLDALAFSKGPGSFTGLRIAAGIIQGLAFPTKLPVVPISSLQTLAQSAHRIKNQNKVLASLNAYRGEVYWGAYQFEQGIMASVIPDQLNFPDDITLPSGNDWFGAGDAWQIYGENFKKKLGKQLVSYDGNLTPLAQDLALLAEHALQNKQYVNAEQALPIYLRGKEAWKK